MTSKTAIYNDVLNLLGSTVFIESAETDTSPKVKAMNAAFDLCRREVLRGHDWGFAHSHVTLSLVGTNESMFAYQYAYPNKCIKAREIQKGDRRAKPIAFKIGAYEDDDNGRVKVLWTDQQEAVLEFTYDETDLDLWDDIAGRALAGLIAFRCYKAITTEKTAKTDAWNYYVAAIGEARAADGTEQVPDEPADCDWIAARANGISSGNLVNRG